MNITWDDSLSTGVAEIDAQHKDFIKLVQRLQMLRANKSSMETIQRILLELVKYADYHFVSEENLMMLLQYPRIKTQQIEHSKLLRALQYKVMALEENMETLDDTLDFLVSWAKKHIKEEDGQIGDFVNARMGQ